MNKLNGNNSGAFRLEFDYATLFVCGNGSGWIRFKNEPLNDPPIRFQKYSDIYAGARYHTERPQLGYDLQDSVIQRFANMEHMALHLWIEAALRDDVTRNPDSTRQSRAMMLKAFKRAFRFNADDVEELFVTLIQILSNGVQPTKQISYDVEVMAAMLGLNPGPAVIAALAFVQYFRAQTRARFSERVRIESQSTKSDFD